MNNMTHQKCLNRPFSINVNKKVLGMIKFEFWSQPIHVYVAITKKIYYFLYSYINGKSTEKRCKKAYKNQL